MPQQIFKSQYPILEACMNKGSTLELAIAVHQAGGYPSLCSWTYNRRPQNMQRDLDRFVATTGSNCIHLSFELYEWDDPQQVIDIVRSHHVPTIEIIYGQGDTMIDSFDVENLEKNLLELLRPIKSLGTKIFRRVYDVIDLETAQRHLLDGFCIKGKEAAGFGSYKPLDELFLEQQRETPSLALIPYGGIGTADQVKKYLDLGAEMVGVGTLLAMSKESPIKTETKLAAIRSKKEDLTEFKHILPKDSDTVQRKQNALQFAPYQGHDDANGTAGLVQGIWKKNSKIGHVYVGHSIDHVKEILPCQQIIQNLVANI